MDSRLSEESLVGAWLDDGRGLLSLVALGLVGAGLFAWFLAVTGQLLPHDVAWLTIDEGTLRRVANGRLIAFMSHDRAAFGGTLVAIGVLYLWLVRFPLADGRAWAWWVLTVGGTIGFLGFLTYLGTGYLDSWHGLATLALLPPFVRGLVVTRGGLWRPTGLDALRSAGATLPRGSRPWLARATLILTGFGMLVAGLTIATIGSLVVFVPEDLEFIGLDRAALTALDERLVSLIAHDRAGFGGGLATVGLTVIGCVLYGPPSRSLNEALLLAGSAGFGAAVGVHLMVRYVEFTHVGPAILGAGVFALGMALRLVPASRRGPPLS